ncbi:MAG: hypothetical protein SFY68_12520 [Candidatus Sumerlaeia bacterium]|nr:hypothetical protein [Candidatus Sumerlaeia bacterium]
MMENRRLLDNTPEILELLKALLGPPTGTVSWSLEAKPVESSGLLSSQGNTIKTVGTLVRKEVALTPVPVGESRVAKAVRPAASAPSMSTEKLEVLRKLSSPVVTFFQSVEWDGSLSQATLKTASPASASILEEPASDWQMEEVGELVLSVPVAAFVSSIQWDGKGSYVPPKPQKVAAPKHITETNVAALVMEPARDTKSAQNLFSDFGFD